MHSRRRRRLRKKQGQYTGKTDARVGDADEHFAARRVRAVYENGRGGAFFGFEEEGFVFGVGQVARLGRGGGGGAGQWSRAVAHDFSVEFFGNLSGGKHVRLRFETVSSRLLT